MCAIPPNARPAVADITCAAASLAGRVRSRALRALAALFVGRWRLHAPLRHAADDGSLSNAARLLGTRMLLAAGLTALFGLTAQVIHGSAASVRLLRRLKLTRLVATRRQVHASCEGEVPAAFDSRVGQIEGEAQRRDGRGAPRLCDGGNGVPSAGTVRSLRCALRHSIAGAAAAAARAG